MCRFGSVQTCMAMLALLMVFVVPSTAATELCVTSGPAAGSYTVTVCVGQPLPDAVLQGEIPVGGSVTKTGGNVKGLQFFVDDQYVLTDFTLPYLFRLSTGLWPDGAHLLHARVLMNDGFLSAPSSIPLLFANEGAVPPPAAPFTPRGGTPPAEGAPLVVAAVGDGGSGRSESVQVADLIQSWNPGLMLYLGDVYERGTQTEFQNWYEDAFGRFRDITNPAPGNHEWSVTGGPGYASYWGDPPSYYSVDAAGWHLVSLNTDPRFGGLAAGSAQLQWLAQDLAQSSARCTIVFHHHPRWLEGQDAGNTQMDPLWKLISDAGVELALAGHDHNYQRWTPLDGNGQASANGVTQMVVGTGGHFVYPLAGPDPRVVQAFGQDPEAVGALRLELGTDSAALRYQSATRGVLDGATVPCHDAAPPPPPPPPGPAFADGFESGNLSAWTSKSGMTVQSTQVFAGTKAARAVSTGTTVAYAVKRFAQTMPEAWTRVRFRVASQSTTVNLARIQTATGGGLATLFLASSGNLYLRNDVAGQNVWSSSKPSKGAWHLLELRVKVAGASSQVAVVLDGAPIPALTKTVSLGTTPIGRLLLGDSVKGRRYDMALDNVEVSLP